MRVRRNDGVEVGAVGPAHKRGSMRTWGERSLTVLCPPLYLSHTLLSACGSPPWSGLGERPEGKDSILPLQPARSLQ